jgi:hypothetical protein
MPGCKIQPIPTVTAEDLERLVRRDFPPDEYDSVMTLLNEYGTENWHREKLRVHLAILRLVEGHFEQLRAHVDMAKHDYRDVLAYAEYPNYMREVPPSEMIDDSTREEIIKRDWRQHQEWLNKK